MKIAVTGGSGFLGTNLIDGLLNMNFDINALSRIRRTSDNSKLKWFQGDLNEKSTHIDFLADCDVVINCAGEITDPKKYLRNNVCGVKSIYHSSQNFNLKIFIQVSSAGIYHKPDEGEISEESKISAYNAYEKSKIDAEKWLFDQNEMKTLILRPTTIYGKDMPNESLRSLIHAISKRRFFYIGSNKSNSCYISVENVVDAIIQIINRKEEIISDDVSKNCEAYNLSHDLLYKDFIEIISKDLGLSPPFLRIPLSVIKALLKINKHTVDFNLPLTINRAHTLSRKSYFSSKKFEQNFNWKPPFHHNHTINKCIEAWFTENLTKSR